MSILRSTSCMLLLFALAGGEVRAQVVDSVPAPSRNQLVRVAKWSTLAATTGAAVYGFVTNRRADDGYGELESMCEADRINCQRRSGGAYEDAELERRYQDVIALDGRARTALVASQLGVAATVLLFIYDLRAASPPRGIPYEPRALQVGPAKDGGMHVQLSIPVGR